MPASLAALVTDQGRRIALNVRGRYYELSQEALRTALGLPQGPPGLGITIEGERLTFEFAADNQTVEMSAAQLHRRLASQPASKTGKSAGPAKT
jgi:hypothetical protein